MINELLKSLQQSQPSKTAAKFFDGVSWTQLSYLELRNLVDGARTRIQELSGGRKTCWGLCVAPCLELPVLILGATLSYCPFMVMDHRRIMTDDYDTYLNDLGVRWVISDKTLDIPCLKYEASLEVNGTKFSILRYKGFEQEETGMENYLYAITTSGSTGRAKVVRAPVESIYPNIKDFSRELGIASDDVILLSSPLTFDPSMVEFFLAIVNRAQLVIVSELVRGCAVSLAQAVLESGVTFFQTTPSLFRLWTEESRNQLLGQCSKLKSLVLGGEPFPSFFEIDRWNPHGGLQIFNTYGITEVSCWATLKQVWPNMTRGQEIDIGTPLGETCLKTEIHGDLHHLFIGSSSRICTVGNETFNELENRKPIFRPTGDLFKIINGKFYFVCRADSIIKRFGRKVDLSHIERLASQLGIECAVVDEGLKNCRLQNKLQVEHRVVMFVIKKNSDTIELNERMVKLKKLLPSHCWPDDVHHVDSLPLSPHGKVDKKRLVSDNSKTMEKHFARSMFSKLWIFFTAGSSADAGSVKSNGPGFISSGGDSYNAVLFISSLEERGVDCGSTDLLMKLLKDVTFEECIKCLLPDDFGSGLPVDVPNIPSTFRQPETEGDSRSPSTPIHKQQVCLALKGQSWHTASSRDLLATSFTHVQPGSIGVQWKRNLGKCVDASPLGVVMTEKNGSSNTFVIIGSHSGLVVVLESKTGKILSQCHLPNRIEASACLASCLQSYYLGCYDGKVYNVSISTGSIIWEFASEDVVKATCVLYNGKVFFGSYDKRVYSITQNGDLIWRTTVGPVTVPVVPYKDTILVGTLVGTVVSLKVDSGSNLWTCHVGAPIFANLTLIANSEQTNVLVCSVDGRMQLIDPQNSNEIAALKMTGSIFSSPVLLSSDSEDVLMADGERLNNIRVYPTAAILWTRQFACRIVATPFRFGPYAVVVAIDGLVSVVKLADGQTVAVYKLPNEVFSSPVVIGSEIFIGCRDDCIYCLRIAS